jgi:hypothetical protein
MLVSFTQMRLFSLISLFTMPLMAAFTLLPPAVAEEVVTSENSEESTQDTDRSQAFSPNPEDATNPESLRPLAQETSLLSLEAGNRLISEGKSAIADENYAQAADKLHQARQIFINNFPPVSQGWIIR